MAGMNGRDLCRTVRERYPDDSFPIFVMTSMTASAEREWVKGLAHVEFLEKPLSPRQLVARLAAYFASAPTKQETPDANAH
jgi:DNA-binding response OmpR family regulator